MDSAVSAHQTRNALIGGAMVPIIMGGFVVLSRFSIVGSYDAGDLTWFRYMSGLIFLPWFLTDRPWLLCGIGWRRGLILSIFGGAPFNLLIMQGFVYAPAAHGAVFGPGQTPTFTFILSWIVLGMKPKPWNLGGMVVLLCGIFMLAGGGLIESGPGAWRGDLLFLGASFMWGVFTVLMRKWQVNPFKGAAVVAVVNMVVFTPIYFLFFDPTILEPGWGALIVQGGYQMVFVGVGAVVLYVRAIPVLGPVQTALFISLVPVMGTLMAIPVLGEFPGPIEWSGIALAFIGMLAAMGVRFGIKPREAAPAR